MSKKDKHYHISLTRNELLATQNVLYDYCLDFSLNRRQLAAAKRVLKKITEEFIQHQWRAL